MVVLTSSRDVVNIWRDTAALTVDPFVQQLMTTLAMSKKTQETRFRANPASFMHGEMSAASLLLKENPMHYAFYQLQMEWGK